MLQHLSLPSFGFPDCVLFVSATVGQPPGNQEPLQWRSCWGGQQGIVHIHAGCFISCWETLLREAIPTSVFFGHRGVRATHNPDWCLSTAVPYLNSLFNSLFFAKHFHYAACKNEDFRYTVSMYLITCQYFSCHWRSWVWKCMAGGHHFWEHIHKTII